MFMRYRILAGLMIALALFPMSALSGSQPGDWNGTWALWEQTPDGGGTYSNHHIGNIELKELAKSDPNYGVDYIVTGSYGGGRIESSFSGSADYGRRSNFYGSWYDTCPGGRYWIKEPNNCLSISKGSFSLQKDLPSDMKLKDEMARLDILHRGYIPPSDFCSGKMEICDGNIKDIWGMRISPQEVLTLGVINVIPPSRPVPGDTGELWTLEVERFPKDLSKDKVIYIHPGGNIVYHGIEKSKDGGFFLGGEINLEAGSQVRVPEGDWEAVVRYYDHSWSAYLGPNTLFKPPETLPGESELEGKGFFEVLYDILKGGKFTVTTKNVVVGVKGTKFYIDASDDSVTRVSVSDGKVEVTPTNPSLNSVTLDAGQEVEVYHDRVGPITSASQTGGSTHVSPEGKDIYGPTGGALQPATSGVAQGGYPDIAGIWYMGGPYNEGLSCQILHNGDALIFINERGDQSAGGFVDSGTVVASDWQGLRGRISDDGKRIDWSNGTWWVRTKQEGNVQPQGTPTSGMNEGCHTDPATGNIICIDSFGNPGQGLNQGNSQVQSGGCYQDPLTGEITCVDTSGIPANSGSGQDNSQGPASGGCYQDPKTGKITCVDAAGTPEGLSAPEKGCYTDPSTGEVTCID